VVGTLDQILAEEKAADAKLTQLSEASMNAKAARFTTA
jgi:ferritin-like metal-binding protein YciE